MFQAFDLYSKEELDALDITSHSPPSEHEASEVTEEWRPLKIKALEMIHGDGCDGPLHIS